MIDFHTLRPGDMVVRKKGEAIAFVLRDMAGREGGWTVLRQRYHDGPYMLRKMVYVTLWGACSAVRRMVGR